MEFLIILGLVLLNGFFSMAEISLLSSRKYKLEMAAKKGSQKAKIAMELAGNPTKFLSTVQIGITLIGVLLGVFSGQNITESLEKYVTEFPVFSHYAHSIAVGLVVVMITYVSIVLGELLPKRIGLTHPESIAIEIAAPMKIISKVTSPFVWLLTKTNDLLLTILQIKPSLDSKVTEEEIKSIIQEGTDGGEIQEIEQDIVERVFDLGDRTAGSLMTHRMDLVWLDINDNLDVIKQKIKSEIHSVYPVGNKTLEETKGIVILKDIFLAENQTDFKLSKYLKQPIYVHDNMPAYKLLERFKVERMHYAIVVDEFGSTRGMLTMNDLMDALVGDSNDFDPEEYSIQKRDDDTWLADAQYPFYDFLRYFDLQGVDDDNDEQTFHTIGGLMIRELKRLPNTGDKIKFANLILEIIDMDGQRIDKILVQLNN
jgi:putative hemolysin